MRIFIFLSFLCVATCYNKTFLKIKSRSDSYFSCPCDSVNFDKEKTPVDGRIIDAYKIPEAKLPFIVSFIHLDDGDLSFCGGLMINSLNLITTSFCMNDILKDFFKYRACVGNRNIAQRIIDNKCREIISYEIFNKLAYIQVKDSFEKENETIDTSCINPFVTGANISIYYVTGSGFIKKDTSNNIEAKISSTIGYREFIKSSEDCSFGDDEIECITSKSSSICYGDSGYPVFTNKKNILRSLGLMLNIKNEKRNCEKGSTYGFIKFDNYRSWLKEKASLICMLGQ